MKNSAGSKRQTKEKIGVEEIGMLLKLAVVENQYIKVAEKIKKELISRLNAKGVGISNINIELNPGSVNVSLKIVDNLN